MSERSSADSWTPPAPWIASKSADESTGNSAIAAPAMLTLTIATSAHRYAVMPKRLLDLVQSRDEVRCEQGVLQLEDLRRGICPVAHELDAVRVGVHGHDLLGWDFDGL